MASNGKQSTEDNSLPGRVRRYAKVGTAMGGFAARLAGERYLGVKGDPLKGAEDLRAALGGLKGPLMKVAQILSTIPDALPKEYARELAQLQANAPHMGWPFVKRRMSNELGPEWQSRFGHFEKEAAAAASLGQVHKAESLDGKPLACKLQYPDMASVVEADLKQLKFAFSVYRRYDQAIDPSEIHSELSDRLREELDYENEARNLALYRYMLRDTDGVHVPEVYDDLSTKRLLTMSWEEGTGIPDLGDLSQDDRNAIAENMFRAWYVPFYHLRRHSRRPAPRQLHRARRFVREPDGLRLYSYLPSQVRIGRDRPLPGARDRRPGPRGPRLRNLGLQRSGRSGDRCAEPLGLVHLCAADGRTGRG